jgi:polyvinyl alcohol dehydrogenase (cytochrome)
MRRVAAVLAAAVVLVGACDRRSAPPSAPAPSEQTLKSPTAGDPLGDGDWPTYHRDNTRAGVAAGLPPLGTLASAWKADLDGAVYGQPLVVGGTLFAATENDTVYALDADSGRVKWSAHVGEPVPGDQLPCGNIKPLGITSTMVYDPATGVVFALAETIGAHHLLYGLDAATGAVKVTRAAEAPKGDPVAHQQRAALTLLGGKVYIAYGGLAGDCANYIGSVVAVPTVGDGPVLSYAIPTTREGGIWTPGGPPVHNGRLLYAVGNGESDSGYDGSDSVIALNPDLTLADRFAPREWVDDNRRDLDLGSMTPVVVNGFVFADGKRGIGYTLRPDHLGGIGGQVADAPLCPAYGGPAVVGDVVYVPCDDGLRAVRVDGSGQLYQLWQAPVSAQGSPVVGGGAVWVVDWGSGVLYALDPGQGTVRQKISVGSAPHFASPTLARGKAYVGTLSGVVAVSGA